MVSARVRPPVVLAVLLLCAVIGPVGAAPSDAAPRQAVSWPCGDPNAVAVVVNFQELGGGVHAGCATNPRDGFDALRQAGFRVDGTIRFPGFLCRIDGKPANDPCYTASPADAYWSYWLAPRGGRWCYSNLGAGNRTPTPGTVEGWSFSKNKTAAQTPPPSASPPPRIGSGAQPQIPAAHCTVPTEGATPTTRPSPPTTARPTPTTRPASPPPTRPTPPAGDRDPSTPPPGRPAPRPDSAPGPGRSPAPGRGDASPAPNRSDGEKKDRTDGKADDKADDESEKKDGSSTTGSTADGADEADDSSTTAAGGGEPGRPDGDETAAVESGVTIRDGSSGGSDDGGSPLPAILTILVLAGIGAATAITVRRRRATNPT